MNDDEECLEHEFRDFIFKRPTFCDQCREFIYSPSRAGVKCTRCNANLHPECAYEVISERRGRFYNDTYINIGALSGVSNSPPMRTLPPVNTVSSLRDAPRVPVVKAPADGEYRYLLEKKLENRRGRSQPPAAPQPTVPPPRSPKRRQLSPVSVQPPSKIEITDEATAGKQRGNTKISFFDFETATNINPQNAQHSLQIDQLHRSGNKKNVTRANTTGRGKQNTPNYTSTSNNNSLSSGGSHSLSGTMKSDKGKRCKWPKTIESDGHRWSDVYFSHPTFCDGCHQFCWGINKKQGYQCKYCKLKVHRKCYDATSSCGFVRSATASMMSAGSTATGDTEEEASGFTDRFTYGEKILGSGAFGVVMDCQRKGTGESFAVKIIDTRKFRFQPKFLDTLNREIGVMMKISHPGIVNLIDSFHENNKVEIVMELVTDGTLQEWLLGNDPARLQEKDCLYIFWQVIVALEYLHDMSITHRDMKPDNILLQRILEQYPMRTKIVDFGFAKTLDEDAYTETVAGTGAYMAPEIKSSLPGIGYTKLVDMWSMGAILYHLLSGSLPFPDPFTPVDRQPLLFPDDPWSEVTEDAIDLVKALLCPAEQRLSATDCLQHPWMSQDPKLGVIFPPMER